MGLRLNLGCSDGFLDGYVNVDRDPGLREVFLDKCDPYKGASFIGLDLSQDQFGGWPWENDSVDEIRAHDIFEHLPDKTFTMNESWRVLRPGGRLDIFIPTTDGRGAWQDPDHKSYWNRNTFFYYTAADPHYGRFARAYGIKGGFRVVREEQSTYPDEVVKLRILLEKVA